jgi:hypothetical protein
MNYIGTWLCADEKGEESKYHQTGELSSSQSHQNIYWRCIVVFFVTSKHFNKEEDHILFTNVDEIPIVDGIEIAKVLERLKVKVIQTDFKYKTPPGYFGSWRNQFYEFSIFEYIANNYDDSSNFLILDSDCIFTKPSSEIFSKATANDGFLSSKSEYSPEHNINGLTRKDMQLLYADLLGRKVEKIPDYHIGEFFLCSAKNVKTIFRDFLELWPQLIQRHKNGQPKFNEEAHILSYLYYKNDFVGGGANPYIRRIWTNPVFLRNVKENDILLSIWHLPAEKTIGIKQLYNTFSKNSFNTKFKDEQLFSILSKKLGIPTLTLSHFIHYYVYTIYNGIHKRIKRKMAGGQ